MCDKPSILTLSGLMRVTVYVAGAHSGSGVFVETMSNRPGVAGIGLLRFPDGHSLESSGQSGHDPSITESIVASALSSMQTRLPPPAGISNTFVRPGGNKMPLTTSLQK